MPRLRQLVKGGDRVVIAFPDRVKGGNHELAHRRVAIPLLLSELERAGVSEGRIKLICAIGLHRKNSVEELCSYLGTDLVRRFWPDRLVCHDAEDPEGIVSLGTSELGDVVEFNREAAEADLLILIGHVTGNPYGGFSGGYKMPATGLTTWRSIRGHHSLASLHRQDFLPANTGSHFRSQLRAVGLAIEKHINKRFFAVDAVLGTDSQILGVYAGATELVEQESWKLAERRTHVTAPCRADALVLGLPRSFHYGPGMGTNPILVRQAIGAALVRCFDALEPDSVIIAASICDGWFNEDWFPATREVFEMLQKLESETSLVPVEEEISTRPTYVAKYREGTAYHPFHAFSMAYLGSLAVRRAGAVFVVGARKPDVVEAMGMIPVSTFVEARDAAAKHLGRPPRFLVLPEYFTKVPVHLYGPNSSQKEENP